MNLNKELEGTNKREKDDMKTNSPQNFPFWFVAPVTFISSSGKGLAFGFECHPNKTAGVLSILCSLEILLYGLP